MQESTAIARYDQEPGRLAVLPEEMSVEVFQARIEREEQMRVVLKDYMQRNMRDGYHYSKRLGTVELPKPMLLQEGTRNICSLFKLFFGEPVIDEKWLDGDHYRVRTHIVLYNAQGGQVSSGDGICSTRETKYAYRVGQRTCPACGVAAIYKDNKSPQGGWYCWAKKDGCGAKFAAGDEAVTSQQTGRIDNPDKADIENTVLKMSIKRAKVAAVCDVAMVSEIFAPDEDQQPVQSPRSNVQSPRQPTASPPRQSTASSDNAQPANEGQGQGGPAGSVQKAVDLAKKLQKDHGVEQETLAMQFLPEGVAMFGMLSEEQAAEAVPGLVELLNTKLSSAKAA